MKFSGAVGVSREEVIIILGPIAPIIYRIVNMYNNGGLEEVCIKFSLKPT